MDQETIRLLISTIGVVLGSLLVAVAAVLAPLIVQKRQHAADVASTGSEQLRESVIDFTALLMREEHYDAGWDVPKTDIQLQRERAFAALDTLLTGDKIPVSAWLRGFMGDRGFHPSASSRRAFIHAGLRDLIRWQQGALSRERLVPFTYIANDQHGSKRVNLEQWQQDAAGDAGDVA